MKTYCVMLFTKDMETGVSRSTIEADVDIDGKIHKIFIDGDPIPATEIATTIFYKIFGRSYLKRRAIESRASDDHIDASEAFKSKNSFAREGA